MRIRSREEPNDRKKIVAFIASSAWTASAQRPAKPHSYTKNWPPEKLVGSTHRGGGDVEFALVSWDCLGARTLGKYKSVLGWHGQEDKRLRFMLPG
jgi:nitric oxide reductase subunit B